MNKISNYLFQVTEEKELLMWGRHIMMGYANRPDATKKDMTEDGWLRLKDINIQKAPKHDDPSQNVISFRSGDLVSIDNENFHAIVGREKVERSIENSNLEQISIGLDHNCGRRKHCTSAHS